MSKPASTGFLASCKLQITAPTAGSYEFLFSLLSCKRRPYFTESRLWLLEKLEMGKIMAAVGAVLRALGSVVWVPCKVTGKLIMKVIDFSGGPAAPAAAETATSVQRPKSAEVIDLSARQEARRSKAAEQVRALAQKMAAQSVTMADMHDVPADVVKWLSSLDHLQLCRLICVEDLDGYMNRKSEVRGLPPYLQPIYRPANDRLQDLEAEYNPPISAPAI